MSRFFRVGDRVRLLKPTPCGWIGTATVTRNQHPTDPDVDFLTDDKGEGSRVGFAHWSQLELIEAANDPTKCDSR